MEKLFDTLGEVKYILIHEEDIGKALDALERMSDELSDFKNEMTDKLKEIMSEFK